MLVLRTFPDDAILHVPPGLLVSARPAQRPFHHVVRPGSRPSRLVRIVVMRTWWTNLPFTPRLDPPFDIAKPCSSDLSCILSFPWTSWPIFSILTSHFTPFGTQDNEHLRSSAPSPVKHLIGDHRSHDMVQTWFTWPRPLPWVGAPHWNWKRNAGNTGPRETSPASPWALATDRNGRHRSGKPAMVQVGLCPQDGNARQVQYKGASEQSDEHEPLKMEQLSCVQLIH